MRHVMVSSLLVLLTVALAGCGRDSEQPAAASAPTAAAGKDAGQHQGHGDSEPGVSEKKAAPAAPEPAAEPAAPAHGGAVAKPRDSILDSIKKKLGLLKDTGGKAEHEGMAMPPAAPPESVVLTPERQQISGVRTGVVEVKDLAAAIRTVGIVDYDERRLARIHTKVEGWIEELFVDFTGKPVRKGDPLFSVYSPELVASQAEYLLAVRAKGYIENSPVPEVSRGGGSLLEAARRRLLLWDITPAQIEELERTGVPKKSLTLYSPIDGIVLKRDVFRGMFVKPDTQLYEIADISTVWVNADIYEYELSMIREGQEATVTLSYYPGQTFRGRVIYIYPYLAEKTRTVRARFELQNTPDWKLKPGMFSNVEVKVALGPRLAVPEEAVLDSGTRRVVFVDHGQGRFDPREVKLGAKVAGYYEVLSGVAKGEKVVTSANFLLDSESRLKSGMGGMAH